MKRCPWATSDPLYISYHDNEWGVPVLNDRKLFEMLILEGMQAGLNWFIILRKRKNFRKAFDNFNPNKIANYSDKHLDAILQDPGIIRNKRKVFGVRQNAKAFLQIKKEYGSFKNFIWEFVEGNQKQNAWKTAKAVPSKNDISDHMSKELKKRGFTFVGSTICYAYMQAVGLVNDHIVSCYRHKELSK